MTVVKKAVAVNAAPQRGGSTPPGRSFENPLAGALWAVSKGMCVSPVTADQKFPPLTPWKETSTRNKADVLALAEKYPG